MQQTATFMRNDWWPTSFKLVQGSEAPALTCSWSPGIVIDLSSGCSLKRYIFFFLVFYNNLSTKLNSICFSYNYRWEMLVFTQIITDTVGLDTWCFWMVYWWLIRQANCLPSNQQGLEGSSSHHKWQTQMELAIQTGADWLLSHSSW